MTYFMRTLFLLVVATVLAQVSEAQKPPAPPPPSPPSSPPTRSTNPTSPNWDITEPRQDLVMFLRGRVATHDGTAVPYDVLVERVCNNKVRQEVYVSPHGDFSMQLGSRVNSFPDASIEQGSQNTAPSRDSSMGIPRRELMNCELRASAPGFRTGFIALMEPDIVGGTVDAGVIVVQRIKKIEGTTVSAIPDKTPKSATKAYEKGVRAEQKGKLDDAQKQLETAVEIYPSSAKAWFQLGNVLRKQDQKDAARKAYTEATNVDTRFLPPFLSLAAMSFETGDWGEVLNLTGHILDLDPFNHSGGNTYFLDLDPQNYGDAYFYNAMANYKLNKLEEAEKSGLKAEHVNVASNFPQLHLLLADLFARKGEYPMAISELETFVELAPHGRGAERARTELARLQKLNGSASTSEQPH